MVRITIIFGRCRDSEEVRLVRRDLTVIKTLGYPKDNHSSEPRRGQCIFGESKSKVTYYPCFVRLFDVQMFIRPSTVILFMCEEFHLMNSEGVHQEEAKARAIEVILPSLLFRALSAITTAYVHM